MGNLITKKKQYRQLEFIPDDSQYQEFDDIDGLQKQIDFLKDTLKTLNEDFTYIIKKLNKDLIKLNSKYDTKSKIIKELEEKMDVHDNDLETLLNNDKVLNARINIIEEKVKYDDFVNSTNNSEYLDTN